MRTLSLKKKWMLTVAAGIIGLAGFGIWNTAASYAQYVEAQTADTVQVSGVSGIGTVLLPDGGVPASDNAGPALDSAGLIPDGAGCPGVCAGCGLCTRGQYQQTTENLPAQADSMEQAGLVNPVY